MSIQWTIIATFLYAEVAVVLLLVLPVASAKRWQGIFRSRFLNALHRQASLYFYVLLFILVLFLLDAMREMRKYSNSDSGDKGHNHPHQLDLEMQVNMRLFRAQRNFYISGFALFLSLVIRRLIILISTLATMQCQSEAALRQAESATSRAKDLMATSGMVTQNSSNEIHDKEVNELKSKISELEKELETEIRDKKALKKQAEALNTEYDRLAEECNKLQRKLDILPSGDKKDD